MSNVLAWILLKSVIFVTSSSSKNRKFLYQPYACNGCHDISLRAISLADIKIILVTGVDYGVVSDKTYDECYCLLQLSSLPDKSGFL